MGSHTLFSPHCILIHMSTDFFCLSFLMLDLKPQTSQNLGNKYLTVNVNKKILSTFRDNVQVQVSAYLQGMLLRLINFSPPYNFT